LTKIKRRTQKGREICDPTYKRNITILPIAGVDICRRVLQERLNVQMGSGRKQEGKNKEPALPFASFHYPIVKMYKQEIE